MLYVKDVVLRKKFLDFHAVNKNFYIVLVVEANETYHSSTLMCGVRVVPDQIVVLLLFDGEGEIPIELVHKRSLRFKVSFTYHASPLYGQAVLWLLFSTLPQFLTLVAGR